MLTQTLGEAIEQAKQLNGVELIRIERERQIKTLGWTDHHDDLYNADEQELPRAALAYAVAGLSEDFGRSDAWKNNALEDLWPWPDFPFNHESQISSYVKAGALIAAEIDRLLRLLTRTNER